MARTTLVQPEIYRQIMDYKGLSKQEQLNLNNVLAIAKCTLHRHIPKCHPTKTQSNRLETIHELRNHISKISTASESSKENNSFNEASWMEECCYDDEPIDNDSMNKATALAYKKHNAYLPSLDGQLRQPFQTDETILYRANTSSEQQLKSGVVVLISQESARLLNHFSSNNVNSMCNDRYSSRSASTMMPLRTPVMLKVHQTSLGKYVVITPSRRHQNAIHSLCLRLKRSQVTVEPEFTSPAGPYDNGPCRFDLITGGADAKSFRFEAKSRPTAMDWAKALTSERVPERTASVTSRRPLVRSPLSRLVEDECIQANDDDFTEENDNLVQMEGYNFCMANKYTGNKHSVDDRNHFDDVDVSYHRSSKNINKVSISKIKSDDRGRLEINHYITDNEATRNVTKQKEIYKSYLSPSVCHTTAPDSARPRFSAPPKEVQRLRLLPTLSESSSEDEEDWIGAYVPGLD